MKKVTVSHILQCDRYAAESLLSVTVTSSHLQTSLHSVLSERCIIFTAFRFKKEETFSNVTSSLDCAENLVEGDNSFNLLTCRLRSKMSAVSREMMFYFCEPYFHTLDRWMKYDDRHLLCNRLQIMAALIEILNARYDPNTTYEIEQAVESEPLLPPIHPSAGETFCDGYDLHAFHTAGTLVSPAVFQTGGLYFQKNLLRALSFGNASTKDNFRDSPAIVALRVLFRLSKESGLASLYSCSENYMGYQNRDLVPLVDLTPDTWTLHDSLIANMVILKAAAEAKRVAATAVAATPSFTVIEAEPIEDEVQVPVHNAFLTTASTATAAHTATHTAVQAAPHVTAMVVDEVHIEPINQHANTDLIITDSSGIEVTRSMIADADSMFSDGTSCVYSHEGIETGARADIIPDATGTNTATTVVTVSEEIPNDSAVQTHTVVSDAHQNTSSNIPENESENVKINESANENNVVEMKDITKENAEKEAEVNNNMIIDTDHSNATIENHKDENKNKNENKDDDEDDESIALPASIVILDKNQQVQDPAIQNTVTSSSQNSEVPNASSSSASSSTATSDPVPASDLVSIPLVSDKETEIKTAVAEKDDNGSGQIPVTEGSNKRKRSSSIDNNNTAVAAATAAASGKRASRRVQNDQTNKDKEEEKEEKGKETKRNSSSSPPGFSSPRSSSRLSVSHDGDKKVAGKKTVRTAVKIIEKRIEGNKEEKEKEDANAKKRKTSKKFTKKGKGAREEDGDEEEGDGEGEDEAENVNVEEEWVVEHPSIGTKVAGIFQKSSKRSRNKTSTVFFGEVTKFLSESGEGERDELYHILWEDGDEEDYDTCDLTEGVRRYKLAKKNRLKE
jgi:hypothetical protein